MWRYLVRILSASATVLSPRGASEQVAAGGLAGRGSIALSRSEIERALDDLVSHEEGFRFQSLAVVLAKKRWPDLIASERKWDLGLDAYAPALASQGVRPMGVACSLTATLSKVKKDAERIRDKHADFGTLIFYTPQKITNHKAAQWTKEIRRAFDFMLIVVSREDLITSLMDPANASLCSSHLGISLPPIAATRDTLEAAKQACSKDVEQWLQHPRLRCTPLVRLRLSRVGDPGADIHEPVDLESIQEQLALSRRLVLEAPGGAGKTTTLVQLAELMVGADRLCAIINLPSWMDSDCDILDFIARSPNFRSRSIRAEDLARLSITEHVDFLLNGWNEISESHFEAAERRLADLERNYPAAGIILATRAHVIKPHLPGASRIQVRELNEEQRREFLEQALGDVGTELLSRINEDSTLDKLTRTPLFLSEVTRLFESGRPIPKTKLDILRAMAERIEDSDVHRDRLQTAPIHDRAESYLSALAFHTTPKGEVLIGDEDARRIVSQAAASLRETGQIAITPEPTSVLNALCAHHVLERIDYPSTSFRFQHHQFQEFYAALRVVRLLETLVSEQDPDGIRDFQAQYLDQPVWGESLQMIAAALGAKSPVFRSGTNPVEIGVCLVKWAITVDPIFAAALARDCGDETWSNIGTELGHCLRRWYAVEDERHRRCAVGGMLATGSPDFADIIIPLLADDDQQVRLRTYRALGALFHVTSLGADWRGVVNRWGEEQRIDFLHEVIGEGGLADVAEVFAESDPSERVQAEAIHVLSWLGSNDAIERITGQMSDGALVALGRLTSVQTLPASVRPRLGTLLRNVLQDSDSPRERLDSLARAAELGDPDAPEDLKNELDALPDTGLRELDAALTSALREVHAVDEGWSSRWIAERIANGSLSADRWISRVTAFESEFLTELLERISSEQLDHPKSEGARSLLAKAADEELSEDICQRLYECQTLLIEARAGVGDRSRGHVFRQLKDLARDLPPTCLVSGILKTLSKPPTLGELSAILNVLGAVGDEQSDFREGLTEADRQSLRDVLARAVPFVLNQDDFSGSMKADLALALARVGDPENADDLRRLINADIERVRRGRQARTRGEQGPIANGAVMSWSTWHVQALTWLGSDVAEPILLELLAEPEYERYAASALARLAVPLPILNSNLGFALASPVGDAGPGNVIDEERRERHADAITARIHFLLEQRSETADPDSWNPRLKALAGVLAYLGSRRSIDLVMRMMSLPGTWDGWARLDTLEHLIVHFSRLPTDATLAIVNPTIEHVVSQGHHDQQNENLLKRCLCILPFVDDPAQGIERIRRLMSSASLPAYMLRELVTALGRSRSEDSLDLLLEMAQAGSRIPEPLVGEWIDAVATIDLPRSRRLLVSFVDPDVIEWGFEIPSRLNYAVGAHIAVLAESDSNVKGRVLQLSRAELSATQRQVLAHVLAQLNSAETVLAGLDLIDDHLLPAVPFELVQAVECNLVERRPHGTSGSTYNLMPQSGGQIRRRLFEMVLNDAHRRGSAFGLLGEIEGWRLDYGKPVSEPRHPAVDYGHPWPPLEFLATGSPG